MALKFEIFPVTAFLQNCTLLWDDENQHAVITDAGGDAERLKKEISKRNLNIKEIWLTHGHLDHVTVAPQISTEYQIPIIGPQIEDLFWFQQLPQITQAYGFPFCESFTPSRWLNEGDQLSVGKYKFSVLHIPGHTPGSVVFYCAQEKLLIGGDVLFRGSIGRTDFPRGSHADLIENIQKKLFILPDDVRIITGHNEMTTIGFEKQYNPFFR